MKICRVCKEEKPLDLFKKSKREKDGRGSICKACHVQHTLQHRRTKHLKNKTDKKCKKCGVLRSIDRFAPYHNNKTLFRNTCRDCFNKDRREIVEKTNLVKYYNDAKNNEYSLKVCKKHGKLSYGQIMLDIHKECDPIIAILNCLICRNENNSRKFNDDNLIINTTNSIIKCNRCLIEKNIFAYYPSELKRSKPTCGECLKTPSLKQHKYKIKKYGLSLNDYDLMVKNQSGLCAICLKPEHQKHRRIGEITRLSVDHNHTTGKVRSLLCRTCNLMLGNSGDSSCVLRKAADYLDNHDKTS